MIDDDDECGTTSGIRIRGETEILRENLHQCHFVRRPLFGLLYQPRMIDDDDDDDDDECGTTSGIRIRRETEILRENLHQCHFVHHKSHMTRARTETGPPRLEAGD
jgi:hypothetical protein